jgi:ABC-type phosphate transport system substrate-binding protein
MNTLVSKLLVCAGIVMFGAIGTQAQDKAEQLAIIVNPASPLNDISFVDLQKYFKAEKTKTPDGTKVVIVMQDVGRPERDAALKLIYKMSEDEYSDYFVGQTFTGAVAAAPKTYKSVATIKKYVAETPGAIAYVRATEADDSVKVLKVNGKSPGDADYKLGMK